ncbi:galactose-binding protein [Riemerella anatipestifer]|uniref:galactose-binding protein n=1 Tax=Riemerella anatipestifer TaxID=34085 RepID=UPI001C6E9297|nr:galactose-binding protein [Riemerella anatipestifer]QYR03382.1 galactose-binding protein [Riemerella anatipestifer]
MTNEVLYTLNGKYFKDFGVFISESKGLLDKPKLKSRRSYDWAEYHGKAIDLAKPKYDEREIELKGWVEGETWSQMKTNFDTLLSEFDKEGLQRLVIEYLGNALVFDVYLSDGVELEKSFKEGKMVGLFTLKMKDPNPIKRVFKLVGNDLQLSFNAQSWVEVNIDGINETRKGNITINKALPSRELSSYGFYGRNFFKKPVALSAFDSSFAEHDLPINGLHLLGSPNATNAVVRVGGVITEVGYWTISFEVVCNSNGGVMSIDINDGERETIYPTQEPQKVILTRYVPLVNDTYNFVDFEINHNHFWLKNLKLEKGNTATDWTPAPEDTHYITISGNIDEITNLQTNAEELWSL